MPLSDVPTYNITSASRSTLLICHLLVPLPLPSTENSFQDGSGVLEPFELTPVILALSQVSNLGTIIASSKWGWRWGKCRIIDYGAEAIHEDSGAEEHRQVQCRYLSSIPPCPISLLSGKNGHEGNKTRAQCKRHTPSGPPQLRTSHVNVTQFSYSHCCTAKLWKHKGPFTTNSDLIRSVQSVQKVLPT